MFFQRLIWAALAVALVVGTLQTGVQRWQAAPLILAAEQYEDQKVEVPAPLATEGGANAVATASEHSHGDEHAHEHEAWAPENGRERTGWTLVANALHAFSMALLVFAVMGLAVLRRGPAVSAKALAAWVALAGFVSLHLWPSLGLPAEVPGMEAAPLQARQLWWVLAVASAALACGALGFARGHWRWPAAAVLLALPFLVGAPELHGDALAGFGAQARAALSQLEHQFAWATTWVAVSFWAMLGLACGIAFQRVLRPALAERMVTPTAVLAPQP